MTFTPIWGRRMKELVLPIGSVHAQETPADFATHVPLAISGNGPWYRLELPLAVQLNARQADLSDVRVFNAAGEPQAYALSRQASQRTESRNVTDVKWFPLYAADTHEALPGVVMKATTDGTLLEIRPSSVNGQQVLRGTCIQACMKLQLNNTACLVLPLVLLTFMCMMS